MSDSVDGVIDRLGHIIEDSIARRDRRGYFAALYNRVTVRVRDGIRAGEFDDCALMERLDVAFARRYLEAYDAAEAGAKPTGCWRQSFQAARRDGFDVVQHLLLGVNAHIHLDLGIAACGVCPGAELPRLRANFHQINDVLSSLLETVLGEVAEVESDDHPLVGAVLSALDSLGGGWEWGGVAVFLDEARASAWRFAKELAPLAAAERQRAIRRRDAHTTLLGHGVLALRPALQALAAGEEDVAEIIRILARGEPLP